MYVSVCIYVYTQIYSRIYGCIYGCIFGCIPLRCCVCFTTSLLTYTGSMTNVPAGTAIAYAVIKYLSEKVGCLSLFSTHYHMLMEEYAQDPLIAMYHMGCRVHPDKESVTFLYKFIKGKSVGSVCARENAWVGGGLAHIDSLSFMHTYEHTQVHTRWKPGSFVVTQTPGFTETYAYVK